MMETRPIDRELVSLRKDCQMYAHQDYPPKLGDLGCFNVPFNWRPLSWRSLV